MAVEIVDLFFQGNSLLCKQDAEPVLLWFKRLFPSHTPNPYAELLMLYVIVLRSGVCERCLAHKRGALVDGIIVLIKETP